MPQDPFANDPFAGGDPFAGPVAAAPPAKSRGGWGDYVGSAIRGLAGFFGSEGLLPGAVIQGAGELGAQTAERIGGSRESFNLPQVGASAALGAVPFGKAAGTGIRYLKGALFGGGTGAVMEAAREVGDDEALDAEKIGRAGVSGGIWGTAGAGAGHLLEKVFGGKVGAPSTPPRGPARSNWGPKIRQESNVQDVRVGEPEPFDPFPTPARQTPRVRSENRVTDIGGDGRDPFKVGLDTQTPQVRQPSNVRDVEGPVGGAIDFGQTPRVRSENAVRDVGDGPSEPWFDGRLTKREPQIKPADRPPTPDVLPDTIEPFEVGGSGRGVSDDELDAAFARNRDSFLDRFMKSIDAGVERRLGESPSAPRAAAPVPVKAQRTAAEIAAETGKTFVPSEIASTFLSLKPKWDKTLADTGTSMHEEPIDFARRVLSAENPRKLMGAERKARAAAEKAGKPILPGKTPPKEGEAPYAILNRLLNDESGEIDPALAQQLGKHAAGAVAGGAAGYFGSDDEDRDRNAVGGALVGAAAPLAFTGKGLDTLNKLRYFSMLGSLGAQGKNLVGNAGSATVRAAEEALVGNTGTAKKLLSSVFSRDTAERGRAAFKHADVPGDTRWGMTSGPLGVPSRLMHAVDEGVTSGLMRGGLTENEAKLSLFTSEPRSKTGQAINNLGRHIPVVMPFTRTATNMVERGLEHTPGVGFLPAVRNMRGDTDQRVAARQAMGALALLTGVGLGTEVDRKYQPYIAAAMGPLALPYAIGTEAKRAYDKRTGDPFTNVVKSPTEVIRDQLPLPGDSYDYDPARLLASFVPGLLKDASEYAPSEFEQPGLFDPAIAKIPFLNTALLRRKPQRASAR